MKLIISIEVRNVEGWSVNWNDEKEAIKELKVFNGEVQYELSHGLGIDSNNITVESKLIKDSEL